MPTKTLKASKGRSNDIKDVLGEVKRRWMDERVTTMLYRHGRLRNG
jgi:hypothetical protein